MERPTGPNSVSTQFSPPCPRWPVQIVLTPAVPATTWFSVPEMSPEKVRSSVQGGGALDTTNGEGVGVEDTDTCCSRIEQPATATAAIDAAAMPTRRMQRRGMYVLPW